MAEDKLELTEEIIQRYYDGEVDGRQRSRIEQALAADSASEEKLARYGRVSELIQLVGATSEADELTARRNWKKISRSLEETRPLLRRPRFWVSVAAAAAFWLFFYTPFGKIQSNELVIESIDCTYASFMLIQPEAETGRTIIWLSDPGDSQQ